MAKKILVIDDENDMRVYLDTLFKKAGFETETAEKPRARHGTVKRPPAEAPSRRDPVVRPRRRPHVDDDWDPRGPWPEDVLDELEGLEEQDTDDVLIPDEDDFEDPTGGNAAE